MRLATWNLNNRVGKMPFRPEAAHAAIALEADVVVLTEYFPQSHHQEFSEALSRGGLDHQVRSSDPVERANGVLIASCFPLVRDALPLPDFDVHFPANVLAVHILKFGLRVLGVRVPAYETKDRALLTKSWQWLEESAATTLRDAPAVIAGDLNIELGTGSAKGGDHFRRILGAGWTRAEPNGPSYFGHSGARSEIDHLLVTSRCTIQSAKLITIVAGVELCGTLSALSDHAALVADIDLG